MGMPQIMKPDARQSRPLDQLLVRVGQEVRVGGCAVGPSEHVRLLVGVVEVRVLASAAVLPFAQDPDGVRVEVDAAA